MPVSQGRNLPGHFLKSAEGKKTLSCSDRPVSILHMGPDSRESQTCEEKTMIPRGRPKAEDPQKSHKVSVDAPILITGAAAGVGGVGAAIVEKLRQQDLPVRALVHREDERAEALRATGAEVVVGDLTHAEDVARALAGCRRLYFGMSVSAAYLEATVTAAAVAQERGDLEVFVNISQMTVSQMSLYDMTDSPQQRQHWLAEQVLNWSGLPCRAFARHGLPPESLLPGLGCRVHRQGRHHPAAFRHRANVAG